MSAESINVAGVISIIVFYLVVLAIGLWAGWRQRKVARQQGRSNTDQEEVMLAGRDIGLFVGILTMGATWVGGGFINGSAQETYKEGLIWTQAPFGYGMSLFISGTFFAKKMRDARYVTMIDPFTQKYGKWGALQALPAAVSEVFWSASILSALGSTLEVILKIDTTISIIISAVIAVLYTLVGGLVSVAYTDVFQLFFIAFGLFLALPFAWLNENVNKSIIEEPQNQAGEDNWLGTVEVQKWGVWADYAFLLLLGGVPWQCYYQRVLSSKTSKRAQILSYGGGLIALIMTAPSVLFGAVARATDWENVPGYNHTPRVNTEEEDLICELGNGKCRVDDTKLVLPLCLQYLTPPAVAFFGLGAISAAVMSSTDSSMLSASTMLARNVFKTVFYPKAKEKHVLIALWILIVGNCACATALAITYQSIYSLFVLCGDFVFVIVFPQLLLVIYYEKANTYGSVFSFCFSLLLRLLCGEPAMNLPPSISFGKIYANTDGSVTTFLPEGAIYDNDEEDYVLPDGWKSGELPFRTFVMLIALISQLLVTELTHYLFVTGKKLDLKYDILKCYEDGQKGNIVPRSNRYLNNATDDITMDEYPTTNTRSSYSNGNSYS